jgi:hypothetical protein
MQAPVNSGSSFFNPLPLHIGGYGCHRDGGVLTNSEFGQALENRTLSIPSDCPLPYTAQPNILYVIVGDEAFPLKLNMLRLYPGKSLSEPEAIFNYRLSRRCRIEQFWNISS